MTLNPNEYELIPNQTLESPDIDIDRNSLEELEHIGSGGTADVTKMRTESGAVVALKQPRFRETLDHRTTDNFTSEAKTWAQLDDITGVVDVIDWGSTPVPWIALEYMDGGSLTARIGETSIEESLWISYCVADAVHQAHRRGVAHFDLKPDNVLFRSTRTKTWDVPKVSDWGLAKQLLHDSRDVDGLSPRYSAPEQLDPDTNESPDDLTDIYQLGVIVYELLTGEPPFSGDSQTIISGHLTESPAQPSKVSDALPTAIDTVIGTALAKKKADRYESMLDFRRDIATLFRAVALDAPASSISYDSQSKSSPAADFDPSVSEDSKTTVEPEDHFAAGSNLRNDADSPGVLDSIQEHSETDENREFPWQQRENAPGLNDVEQTTSRESSPALDGTKSKTKENHKEQSQDSDQVLSMLLSVLKRLFGS